MQTTNNVARAAMVLTGRLLVSSKTATVKGPRTRIAVSARKVHLWRGVLGSHARTTLTRVWYAVVIAIVDSTID
jgi:hypothetical protein